MRSDHVHVHVHSSPLLQVADQYAITDAITDEFMESHRGSVEEFRDFQRRITVERIKVYVATSDDARIEHRTTRWTDVPSRTEMLLRALLPRRIRAWRRNMVPHTHTLVSSWRPLLPDVPVPRRGDRVTWHRIEQPGYGRALPLAGSRSSS